MAVRSLMDIKFSDEIAYEKLIESEDLVQWTVNAVEKKSTQAFFGDSFSAVLVFPKRVQGVLLDINSGLNSEAAQLRVDSTGIFLEHINDQNRRQTSSKRSGSILNDFVVIGVQFGVSAKKTRLILDGSQTELTTAVIGIPVDFSYLEKNLMASSSLSEILVFKRSLSSYELALMSRQIARLRGLTTVKLDRSITPDTDFDFTSESPQFLAARAVLSVNSCFNCHSAWGSYGEYEFVKARVVVAKNKAESLLWTRLSSTFDMPPENQQKNMPLNLPQISLDETNILKEWIDSIQ